MNRYDPYHPAALAWPYPFYHQLRAADPVHWGVSGEAERPGTWYLLRFTDVTAALKDQRLGREAERLIPAAPLAESDDQHAIREITQHWMILRDPPAHTRLRALVNRAFTPRMAEQLEPRIEQIADDLVRAACERGTIDIIADLARPLPVLVIAEVLGVPPSDHALFLPWALALAATIDLRQTPEVRRRGAEAMAQMVDYLRSVVALRRRAPGDDLLSALLAAEDASGALSEDEVLGTIILLLTAGNDPVTFMIGNFVLTLLDHPATLARLRAEPHLAGQAADELLRYDSSVQMTFRYALEDVAYGGKHIHAGDHLALVFGSALRDPAYTPEPDTLDIDRANNRLPYGLGIHFCLGSALARSQGRIALDTLLRRLPHFEHASETRAWQPAAAVRGVTTLPLLIEPR
jgi:hypothetical protein